MKYEDFASKLIEINITLSKEQFELFEKYYEILITENEKYNLTAITEQEEVYYKHFYDSLVVLKYVNLDDKVVCDVGSGAGFPAIPLKIIKPSTKVVLVDSLQKRINFLEMVVEELGLSGVECVHARAEDFAKTNFECFDIVTARAVANLQLLTELCIPLVKPSGLFVALKGPNGLIELEYAMNAIKVLGSEVLDSYEYDLFDYGKRSLLLIEKVDHTPKKYPRQFSQIKKNPL